jgi:hypothetical protein
MEMRQRGPRGVLSGRPVLGLVCLALLAGGCGGYGGLLMVTTVGGKVAFALDPPHGATAFGVEELHSPTDATTRCLVILTDRGWTDRAKLGRWWYGQDVGDSYHLTQQCEPLASGPLYEARAVFPDHSSVMTKFRIRPDGTVEVLDRGSTGAWM